MACLLGVLVATGATAAPLRVGIDLDGEPMTFLDEKGVPSGFAVELVNAIARDLKIDVVFVARHWPEMMEDFRAGRTDVIANITYTDERATFIDFSDPHLVMNGAIFVRKGDTSFRSTVDLRGRRVAVKLGGAPHRYLQSHGWDEAIVASPTLRDSLRAVSEGRADAALDARIIGQKNVRDDRLRNVVVADVELLDFAQRLHFGFQRGNIGQIALFNDGLARLHASGAYDQIYDRWIGPIEPRRIRWAELRPYLISGSSLLCAAVVALIWQRRLLQRLARQAHALRESEQRLTVVLEASRQAEAEAARHEARFRFIFEFAPVGLAWQERDRPGSRLVNATHERITGVPATEAGDERNYLLATHPDDREREAEQVALLSRGEIDRIALEKRYVHRDGTVVWAVLNTRIFRDPVSHAVQEVTTLVDVNELKRTEADRERLRLKMLEAQKLESLGVLAGGIAHDFNNLLTVILANATLVREDTPAGDERLSHIEAAARRAADLCRQMLAYAGKGNILLERVELGALVCDTAQLLRVSLSKKARLELDLAGELPAVDGDASQLRQVVMNLVINASEALGDAPGVIRITTRLDRVGPHRENAAHAFDLPAGECVCLEISDTGQGMSAATLERIFDPFFTTKFAGRGLGLAAVLGIVRAHHGGLTVSSEPGVGSTFRLFLPALSAAAPDASAVSRHDAGRRGPGGGTILVADDEPGVLAATAALLRHHGYQTVLTVNGEEAVRRFRAQSQEFAAVLLDLTMPGMDGAEAARMIRADYPAARVLMMSGFSEVDVIARLRGLGNVSIVRKPFTKEQLLTRIAEVIAGKTASALSATPASN